MAPKTSTGSKSAHKARFSIDCSKPANDGVFDTAGFEKYLHDNIKVEGKAGALGDSVKVQRDGNKVTVVANIAFSKRYLKYLTKKFLKKNSLRDWIRSVDL
ncbi:hypothetical protein Clacol_003746 [Clathrus columnatus]|uniref:60S ribosomal protein L22 n=1 Tax=Clathrus columnatus TaxID=1419009 RepID=A0AAV5AA42_9AGAM|nr:hypothetical protein Clacol_003746 [Clathrus columnatus]